jgi:hypothetical protein
MVRVRSIVVVAVATAMTITLSAAPAGAQRCGGVIRDGECAPTTSGYVPEDVPDIQPERVQRTPPQHPPSLTVPKPVVKAVTTITAAVTLNVAVPKQTPSLPTYRSTVVAHSAPFAANIRGGGGGRTTKG